MCSHRRAAVWTPGSEPPAPRTCPLRAAACTRCSPWKFLPFSDTPNSDFREKPNSSQNMAAFLF